MEILLELDLGVPVAKRQKIPWCQKREKKHHGNGGSDASLGAFAPCQSGLPTVIPPIRTPPNGSFHDLIYEKRADPLLEWH
jgi:hypothetical protein